MRDPQSFECASSEAGKKISKASNICSDAHFGFEIGNGRTIVSDDVRYDLAEGKTDIEGEESNYYLAHGLSICLKR